MDINQTYKEWIVATKDNAEINNELISVKEDAKQIEDRFYKALSFGTGGMRGVLGAGTNRMNVYTVGRATLGLADYILQSGKDKSIVIAYDSRNKSREFAFLAADIMSYKGIKAYVFNELMPTPVLSFAVRYLKTTCGIVITASHNPKEYNGYKVYNEHGCQITDETAKIVTDNIEKHGYFEEIKADKENVVVLDDKVLDAFLTEIGKCSVRSVDKNYLPKIVYTPLHGTGNKPVRKILNILGITDVTVVKEQELPDGEFTTCPFPNPEEREALTLAIEKAKEIDADIVLATDPDADRVGIAVKDKDGTFKLFNGNETGLMMMNYMLQGKKENNTLGKNPTVIKTVVSSDMAFAIADKYGATVKEVLTGFKYIGEELDRTENFVMGMEESYGYLVGRHARDKDAVSAVMIIAEMCAYYKAQNKSLCDVLEELYREFGFYRTDLVSKKYEGKSGMEKMAEITDKLRKSPITTIHGEKAEFTDFINGVNGLPKSNVLRFKNQNIRVIVRPSGTEPKLKIYYQVKGSTEEEALKVLSDVKEEIVKILD